MDLAREFTEDNYGKYALCRRIGAGGMGEVWLAKHTELGQQYAVKLVGGGADAKERQALHQEAARMRGLRDSRIPYLVDYMERGTYAALVMEYVEGETLSDYAAAHAPLRESEALELLRQLCGILAYLHGQEPQIVYRDVKPSNFIRSADGVVHLVDFGTSLSIGNVAGSALAGTPGYAPREQRCGVAVTPAADVYALGAVYAYLLTGLDPGQPPYRPAGPERLRGVASAGTVRLLRRCLAEDPQARYPDAAALQAAAGEVRPLRRAIARLAADLGYYLILLINILVWLGVIYAREKAVADIGYECAAALLFAVTALWLTYRNYVDYKSHFVVSVGCNLLYTQKQGVGL